jgi:TonB-dependent receptor
VPAGDVRLAVAFEGLESVEVTVKVGPGETVARDVAMRDRGDDPAIVKLGAFRVATDRDATYKAIQQQRSALEIKSVIASDAFGNVSEGNVGEFLKLMPGVMMDYVDADVRTVSIGGFDPKYALILMDGAPVASAGSSNIRTGRAFEFEQLSISSIEAVELSKTPTPDVAGSALAGVINLRSKGAFDRKGRQIAWSAGVQLNSHHLTLKKTQGFGEKPSYKFQPNVSLEYSDVILGGKLGILAGYNFAQTLVEQNITLYAWTFDADPANNGSEVPRLNTLLVNDAPKVTDRANYNLRLDYKFSPELTGWVRGDFNTYEAEVFGRNALLEFGNAINSPTPTDPRVSGVEYSMNSQSTTLGSAQLQLGTGFNKHGATTTLASGVSFKRGGFRFDLNGQWSRSTNYYDDLEKGYFSSGTTGRLTNLPLTWSRPASKGGDISVTQQGGPDWRNPASYTTPAAAAGRDDYSSKDQRWTGKADFRYEARNWIVPTTLKWGGDIGLQVRDVIRGTEFSFPYLGPDRLPGTGDERWPVEQDYRLRLVAGGNLNGIPTISRWAMAREFAEHPDRFVLPNEQTRLLSKLRGHWDVKEQIDSLYTQVILKVSPKFDLAPGVRVEKTRSSARGPVDRGDDYAKQLLTGNPNATIPTTTVEYTQARYGSEAANNSDYHTWLKYLHATYRLSDRMVLRGSFNESITRPNLDNLAGGVTLNPDVTPPTAAIANPGLRPEHGSSFFASAEYYFPKGGGFLTVSVARREISDIIQTNVFDVPIGEDYINSDGLDLGGYRVSTTENVGDGRVASAEISYRQNVVFLPGFWRRVSVFGNYTRLHYSDFEKFRRPANLANGGVSFDYHGLSLRWNVVWVPTFRRGAIPANGWVVMDSDRLTHDAHVTYNIWRNATVFLSARNIFNRPQRNYFGPNRDDILNSHNLYGAVLTIGVNGRF